MSHASWYSCTNLMTFIWNYFIDLHGRTVIKQLRIGDGSNTWFCPRTPRHAARRKQESNLVDSCPTTELQRPQTRHFVHIFPLPDLLLVHSFTIYCNLQILHFARQAFLSSHILDMSCAWWQLCIKLDSPCTLKWLQDILIVHQLGDDYLSNRKQCVRHLQPLLSSVLDFHKCSLLYFLYTNDCTSLNYVRWWHHLNWSHP